LEPIKRNVTRWSSTYCMLKRFFELKPFLDETDEDIARYIPSGNEIIRLQKLLEDMVQFESITKQLQDASCTLSDVREMFDTVIDAYSSMEHYLNSDAPIDHSPDFENGIIKVMNENIDELSNLETIQMEPFRNDLVQMRQC
jgi:hypothetical protein